MAASLNSIRYYGGVVLSKNLRKILLVKPTGQSCWCLPIGRVNGCEGIGAAGHVIEHQAGIIVHHYLTEEDSFEVNFPADMSTKTKLYIAHGVRCDKLMPAPDSTVDEAAWMDFEDFLTDSFDSEELCAPFRPPLREWIGRHHHLRGDKDVRFGRALAYNKHRWIGARPGDYLSSLLSGLSVAPAEYHVFPAEYYFGKGKSVPEIERTFYACTCVLRHAEHEITPHICYTSEADAREMAALAGILYINDCLDSNSKNFTVAQLDSTDIEVSYWNERLADFITNQYEGAKPGGNLCHWKSSTGGLIPPEAVKKFKSQGKTASMLLAEFVERRQMSLKFDFEVIPQGFVGRVTIPELKYDAFRGSVQSTRKAAKQNVAFLVLESLKTKGLYST